MRNLAHHCARTYAREILNIARDLALIHSIVTSRLIVIHIGDSIIEACSLERDAFGKVFKTLNTFVSETLVCQNVFCDVHINV